MAKPTNCNCRCGCEREFNSAEVLFYRDLDSDNDTVLCYECAEGIHIEDGGVTDRGNGYATGTIGAETR